MILNVLVLVALAPRASKCAETSKKTITPGFPSGYVYGFLFFVLPFFFVVLYLFVFLFSLFLVYFAFLFELEYATADIPVAAAGYNFITSEVIPLIPERDRRVNYRG